MHRRLVLFAAVIGFSACLQAQRPARIHASPGPEGIDALARALASEGQTPDRIERDTGLVITRWRQDGFCAHPRARQGETALGSGRYIAALSGEEVTLRVERQCCLGGSLHVGETMIAGDCVDWNGVTEGQQAELDALASKLQGSLGPKSAASAL
jgi:hypothetical protein